MLKKTSGHFALGLLLLVAIAWLNAGAQSPPSGPEGETGTLEKMIVASGNVAIDLDLGRLREVRSEAQESKWETVRFDVSPNSFFTILVFNNVLRGPEPGSMGLIWENSAILPEPLNTSVQQLIIEKRRSNEPFEFIVRDQKTAFVCFNIEGSLYDYDAAARLLRVNGRLLISGELAGRLGRPADAGATVGEISITATMSPIEVTKMVNGAATSKILPPRGGRDPSAPNAVPGPDVIVGELSSLQQFGSSGTQVGLAMGTDSCNNGDVELDFFAMPNTDHPVLPQNLYRMSGGSGNDARFEQVGRSWLAHAFFALQQNACGFGCTPASNGTHLGVGCSNADSASINASQVNLGSRAWVNPFTGTFPSTANTHTGHTHTGTSHRLLVEQNDLNTTMNPGATYYAEAQFVTPHEYAWCQSHPGQCNMYNNASYRQFNVAGTTNFVFSAVGSTVRMSPAITAWPGATIRTIEPAPGMDGRAFLAYKVTGPVAGIYHYEYAIYNQNLDRGIQSFSLFLIPPPIVNGAEIAVQSAGFHAPPQHPGFANDGTQGDAGYSDAPWTFNATVASLTWHSETFAQNPNANAIRWGTLYNFRFDSSTPPVASNATVGFFKTGTPITVPILGVAPIGGTPTPTPIPTPSPIPGVSLTPGMHDFGSVMLGSSSDPFVFTVHNNQGAPVLGLSLTLSGTGASDFSITSNNCGSTLGVGMSCTLSVTFTPVSVGPKTASLTVSGSNSGSHTASLTGTGIPATTPTPTPGPATHFEVVAPQWSIENHAFLFTVRALDQFNNTATDYTGTVHFTSTEPLAELPPDGMLVASGTGTFEATFHIPGFAWTITATDTVNPSITGTSNAVFVLFDDPPVPTPTPSPTATPTPGPATHFEVIAPAAVGAFQAFNFTVRALDQLNNTATNYIGTVHFTSTGQPASLPPDSTLTNGTGTFSATFFTLGNWTITATDTVNSSITGTSNDILVVDDQVPTPTPTPTPPTQALNVSTRLRVQTGDNAGFGGFIITGTESKHVLLRGIGPSLLASGITDALANPTLDLRDSAGVRILANDNWRDTQETEVIATGIPPTDNLEAAIVQTLAPGSYTVILRGMGMTSGVGLVEIYDLNPGAVSKLGNLSTRAFVDTGNNAVIAGFILGGSGDDRVVLRGIGPSLTAAGITNALPDPTLELRDSNGVLLRANNDWETDPDQAAQLTAAGLAPTNGLESGVAASLSPGLYTALLAGANNGTGVGVVEVYDLGAP